MRPRTSRKRINTIFPKGLSTLIAKQISFFIAILILIYGIVSLLSLLSHEPTDPSFGYQGLSTPQTSSEIKPTNEDIFDETEFEEVSNWLGLVGSYYSDLSFNFLGLAAYIPSLLAILWSFLLFFSMTPNDSKSIKYMRLLSIFSLPLTISMLITSYGLFFLEINNDTYRYGGVLGLTLTEYFIKLTSFDNHIVYIEGIITKEIQNRLFILMSYLIFLLFTYITIILALGLKYHEYFSLQKLTLKKVRTILKFILGTTILIIKKILKLLKLVFTVLISLINKKVIKQVLKAVSMTSLYEDTDKHAEDQNNISKLITPAPSTAGKQTNPDHRITSEDFFEGTAEVSTDDFSLDAAFNEANKRTGMLAQEATDNNTASIAGAKNVDTTRVGGISSGIVRDSYAHPPTSIFDSQNSDQFAQATISQEQLSSQAELLRGVLEEYKIYGEISNIRQGPVVTLFELEPRAGTKISRVVSLSADIARNMSAVSARISSVPGSNVIGIELPNLKRSLVSMRSILEDDIFTKSQAKLPIILGRDIFGSPIIADLADMPHLLIAGTTGSGKSVGINAMIISLLYKLNPEECRIIMIDPKMLELSIYEEIPHLLTPVVTDPKSAIGALKWAVNEMEERYKVMSKLGVRNIENLNLRVLQAERRNHKLTRKVQVGFDDVTSSPIFEEETIEAKVLPHIVVIVDEMADLMLVAGKEVELLIQRLAQMARAAGIHLIMATQRPSVDVITGTIKANFPTRISYKVTTKIDSRTIIGEQGAEQLLGKGDLLFLSSNGEPVRVHAPFCSEDEVAKVCSFWKNQAPPNYLQEAVAKLQSSLENEFGLEQSLKNGNTDDDELYQRAKQIVISENRASISFIQRQLQIGYNRAAKFVEIMEKEGLVSKPDRVGRREVLN